MDKAAVLIDGAYVNRLNHDHFGMKRIDYLRFSDGLCQPNCERFRTYYYNCSPYQDSPPTQEQRQRKADMDKFLAHLKAYPRFEVRLGVLRRDLSGNFQQKGVDVLQACDLVNLAAKGAIHKAVIVSGDADIVPAVKIAKEEMIITKLAYHPNHCAPALFQICDENIQLTQSFIDSVSF